MLPNLERLSQLRHDEARFEAERNRIISEYIASIPEERRKAAYTMQLKIDSARTRLSQDEFLKWMQMEAVDLAENLSDQFSYLNHRLQRSLNGNESDE